MYSLSRIQKWILLFESQNFLFRLWCEAYSGATAQKSWGCLQNIHVHISLCWFQVKKKKKEKKRKKEIKGIKIATNKRSVDIKMQLWVFKSELAGLKSSCAAKCRANTSLIHIIWSVLLFFCFCFLYVCWGWRCKYRFVWNVSRGPVLPLLYFWCWLQTWSTSTCWIICSYSIFNLSHAGSTQVNKMTHYYKQGCKWMLMLHSECVQRSMTWEKKEMDRFHISHSWIRRLLILDQRFVHLSLSI